MDNTQTELIIPGRPSGRYHSVYIRSVPVFSVDYEAKLCRRKTNHPHIWYAENYQPERDLEMSGTEEWEWIIRQAIKRKNESILFYNGVAHFMYNLCSQKQTGGELWLNLT